MALKVKFANNTEQAYLNAIETEEYYNGSSRRTLTFHIARDGVNLETLDGLCTEANLSDLTLFDDESGVTNVYTGYVLKLKVGVEPVLVNAEQNTYEERITVKLGKRTYIEQQLHALGVM